MKKNILYFDILSGISGDMTIGALLDLNDKINFEILSSELDKLNLSGFKINISKTLKNGISGTKFDVILEEECHVHRTFKDVTNIIEQSSLSKNIKNLSKQIFLNIALAEAKIHNKNLNEVHFHEVGAVDSIVDIVCAAICIDALKVDEIISSPVHVGTGFVKSQHGVIPVPAPATLEILKNIPIYSKGIESELVTPTGAAILKTLVHEFSNTKDFSVTKIGYGHGTKDLEVTNTLRVMLCEKKTSESLIVLETNIDDMSSEIYSFLYESLLENGALDVYSTPIFMKKNRPSYKLSVICNSKDKDSLEKIIFKETTTYGIRYYEINRTILERDFKKIKTSFGEVSVKNGYLNNDLINSSFEYEEMKKIAIENNLPLNYVYEKCKHNLNL